MSLPTMGYSQTPSCETIQALSPQYHNLRTQFCVNFQKKLPGNRFAEKVIFSDEVIFHASGKVNRHNVRVWGTQNAHEFVEHVRDSPKVSVFCAISALKVYG